jgi:hypothetical protein
MTRTVPKFEWRCTLIPVLLACVACGACAPPAPSPRSDSGAKHERIALTVVASPATRQSLGVSRWHATLEEGADFVVVDGADSRGRVVFSNVYRPGKRTVVAGFAPTRGHLTLASASGKPKLTSTFTTDAWRRFSTGFARDALAHVSKRAARLESSSSRAYAAETARDIFRELDKTDGVARDRESARILLQIGSLAYKGAQGDIKGAIDAAKSLSETLNNPSPAAERARQEDVKQLIDRLEKDQAAKDTEQDAQQDAALEKEEAAAEDAEQDAELQREEDAAEDAEQDAELQREEDAAQDAEQDAELQREEDAAQDVEQDAELQYEEDGTQDAEQDAELQYEEDGTQDAELAQEQDSSEMFSAGVCRKETRIASIGVRVCTHY